MKPLLKFNMKIPWNKRKKRAFYSKTLFVLLCLLTILSDYNVALQRLNTNYEHQNNKRNVDDITTTTAVIQKDLISDDAFNNITTNCPSLDRRIYKGHSPIGFLNFGPNDTSKITYEKVSMENSKTLEGCLNECCNVKTSCEAIFSYSNNSILNCFMITCHEGRYCLPSKSSKSVENSTSVVLLRPPSGVSKNILHFEICLIYSTNVDKFIYLYQDIIHFNF